MRFPVVAYHRYSEAGAEIVKIGTGIVTDISSGGIGLILDQPIRLGLEVLLVLNADSPQEQLLEALALSAGALPCSGNVLKAGSGDLVMWRIGLVLTRSEQSQVSFVQSVLRGQFVPKRT